MTWSEYTAALFHTFSEKVQLQQSIWCNPIQEVAIETMQLEAMDLFFAVILISVPLAPTGTSWVTKTYTQYDIYFDSWATSVLATLPNIK